MKINSQKLISLKMGIQNIILIYTFDMYLFYKLLKVKIKVQMPRKQIFLFNFLASLVAMRGNCYDL